MVALEAAVNDWLPCVRIASWPGVLGDASEEAGDTFVVRPVQNTRRRSILAETALYSTDDGAERQRRQEGTANG
jgi:hypothetical protein